MENLTTIAKEMADYEPYQLSQRKDPIKAQSDAFADANLDKVEEHKTTKFSLHNKTRLEKLHDEITSDASLGRWGFKFENEDF